jgi:NADH dehydrogenase/NADH:ubiquinone oxidoreductase subunit G
MFGWDAKAKRFEHRAYRFTEASRRLNILANDLLRYIELCDSMAAIAREAHATHQDFKTTTSRFSVSKNDKEKTVLHRHAKDIYSRIVRIRKRFEEKKKLLDKAHYTYKGNLDKLSKAIRID